MSQSLCLSAGLFCVREQQFGAQHMSLRTHRLRTKGDDSLGINSQTATAHIHAHAHTASSPVERHGLATSMSWGQCLSAGLSCVREQQFGACLRAFTGPGPRATTRWTSTRRLRLHTQQASPRRKTWTRDFSVAGLCLSAGLPCIREQRQGTTVRRRCFSAGARPTTR